MEKQTERILLVEEDGLYKLKINGEILKTPEGDEMPTSYKELAEALRKEYKKNKEEGFNDWTSLLCFHFFTVSVFQYLKKDEAFEELMNTDWEKDWSVNMPNICFDRELAGRWGELFGNPDDRKEKIKEWLKKCTHMQKSVIFCLYHIFGGYNIVYLMAFISEHVPADVQKKAIKDVCDLASCFVPFLDSRRMMPIFNRFSFYYGLHTKEYGGHIDSLN